MVDDSGLTNGGQRTNALPTPSYSTEHRP